MTEFRVWFYRWNEMKWGVILADSLEEAEAIGKKKYGARLVSVKAIVKGKSTEPTETVPKRKVKRK